MPFNYGVEAAARGQYRKYLMADSELKDLPIHQEDHSYVDNLVNKFAQAITLYKESSP